LKSYQIYNYRPSLMGVIPVFAGMAETHFISRVESMMQHTEVK